jgi:hypothetical protein
MKLIVKVNYTPTGEPRDRKSNVTVALYEPKRDATARYKHVETIHHEPEKWIGETAAVNAIVDREKYRGKPKTITVVACGENGFEHCPYVFRKL